LPEQPHQIGGFARSRRLGIGGYRSYVMTENVGPRLRLRDRAYDEFTRRLLDERIRPGQFVTQRELVDLTGMSLGAIRELIPKLEADGLIVTLPQRGLQVAALDLDLIRNAFQLRLFLEREAAALFAANAAEPELARLRQAHEAIISAAEGGITQRLIDRAQAVDWNLHDTIIDGLRNEIVANIYRVNSIKIRLIRQRETLLNIVLVVAVMEEHLRIVHAFEQRDPVLAATEIGRLISGARVRALRV
jgi:DNA-binding GntR family transcriptional regulator